LLSLYPPPSLFYDAVSIYTIVLNGRVIDDCKLERIFKEVLWPDGGIAPAFSWRD
jgi:hypothetical protein